MVKISLRELIAITDPSGNNPAGQAAISGLLDVDPVRSAFARKIKGDFAKNKMAELLQSVVDDGVAFYVFKAFEKFVINEAKPPQINNPVLLNKPSLQRDNIKDLIVALRNIEPISDVLETSKSQFMTNASNYYIELANPEVLALDETSLSSLYAAGFQLETIVPKSAIMMNDNNAGDKYSRQPFPVYTGIDMRVIFMTPHMISQNITLKVLSYSTHSGLIPVSTLGRKQPKGFAEGDTNIAGSMIATLTVNDPLADMQPLLYGITDYAKNTNDVWKTYMLPDQFPLFDVVLLFSNEAGFTSSMAIFGIKITDVGSVMSMSDSEIEVTYTYTALDIELLRGVQGEGTDRVTDYDIMQNAEYLTRRKMAYDGNSTHRDHFEVGEIYGKLDNRAREIAYNNLRMQGYNIVDVYNFQKFNEEI